MGTSLDPGSKLSIADSPQTIEDAAVMRSKPYAEAVGTLMYIAIATRPDIAYAVGVLSRFSSNPGVAHWKAVQHLFRYMQATKDLKLTYAPDPSQTDLFTTYCDADFAGNIENKRSTSGYVGLSAWGLSELLDVAGGQRCHADNTERAHTREIVDSVFV